MIDIIFEFENKRAAAYDNKKLIGKSTISSNEKFWIINHTEVDKNYTGQGIAKKLIKIIVDEARKKNLKILPLCSYAKKEFEKNKEYQEIIY